MSERRAAAAVLALALVATACSSAVQSSGGVTTADLTGAATTDPPTAAASTTDATNPAASDAASPATTPATTRPSTIATTTTTTTTTTPPLDVYDIQCALEVFPGETLDEISELINDDTVDPETIIAENDLGSPQLVAGQLLDVCVDNGINDIDGTTRTERPEVFAAREVMTQQSKLNELFAGYGIRELLVDGISGPVTRQRLCAFRLSANLPTSTDDMIAGSEEEQLLMNAEELGIPFTSAILAERWVLIDETCQIMFVGVGTERLDFVFPTSTGQAGFETRPQTRSDVFKFNPASGNGGWHNSTTFPAAEDNPLNGNMYKPLYFDLGLAIHGANNVPRSPASKGCARLRVADQDALIDWLDLEDQNSITYNEGRINLAVNVQGRYQG